MTDIRPIHIHPRTKEVMREIGMAEWPDDTGDYVREIGDLLIWSDETVRILAGSADQTEIWRDITEHVKAMYRALTDKPERDSQPWMTPAKYEEYRKYRPRMSETPSEYGERFGAMLNEMVAMMQARFDVLERRSAQLDKREEGLNVFAIQLAGEQDDLEAARRNADLPATITTAEFFKVLDQLRKEQDHG
jgi:hypothetical protein